MTRHCSTCSCSVGEAPPQPSESSPGIRRLALEETRRAVRAAKDGRKKPAGEVEG